MIGFYVSTDGYSKHCPALAVEETTIPEGEETPVPTGLWDVFYVANVGGLVKWENAIHVSEGDEPGQFTSAG